MGVEAIEGSFTCGVTDDVEFEPTGLFDRETDHQIEDCLTSLSFQNRVFSYSYDYRSYEVRIVHNPDQLTLKIGDTTSSSAFMIISKGPVPEQLMAHLQRLAESLVGETAPSFISNQTVSSDFEVYAALTPVKETPRFLGPPIRNPFNSKIDQQIQNCFSSDQFVNTVVTYPFKDRIYTLRIIHNPTEAELVADNVTSSCEWAFAILSDSFVPYELLDHLQALSHTRWDETAKVYIANQSQVFSEGGDRPGMEVLQTLRPVRIHKDGEFDAELDQQIREVFQSKVFTNRTLSYNFDGINYVIRIIHNPDKENIKITNLFWWNMKYGIFTEQAAPYALITHIQRLIDSLSWWDYFFNLDIHNKSCACFHVFSGLKVKPKA